MEQKSFEAKLEKKKDKLLGISHPALRRMVLTCDAAESFGMNRFLYQTCGLRFAIATGLDTGQTFEVLYHYSNDQSGYVVTLKSIINNHEHPEIKSIVPLLPGAEWIEREMHDLLGIEFKGHPNLKRLLLIAGMIGLRVIQKLLPHRIPDPPGRKTSSTSTRTRWPPSPSRSVSSRKRWRREI